MNLCNPCIYILGGSISALAERASVYVCAGDATRCYQVLEVLEALCSSKTITYRRCRVSHPEYVPCRGVLHPHPVHSLDRAIAKTTDVSARLVENKKGRELQNI